MALFRICLTGLRRILASPRFRKWALGLLTFSRIPLAFLVGWLLYAGYYYGAALVFAVGGFTDVFDGPLARRWQMESEGGHILDHVADKIFIFPGIIFLFFNLPWFLVWPFATLEKITVWITYRLQKNGEKVEWPNTYGKRSYVFAVGGIIILLLSKGSAFWWLTSSSASAAIIISMGLRFLSFYKLLKTRSATGAGLGSLFFGRKR